MARGSSIWVVQKAGEVVAAFSVRHELQTYLAREHPDLVEVIYLPDGYQLTYTTEGGYLFNNGRQPVKLDPKTLKPVEVVFD
jgi:hypothetical protein